MENDKINEHLLAVQKRCIISPEHAAILETARLTGRDVSITLTVQPLEFSDKPTEDGKFDAIYRTGIRLLTDLEIV